MYFDCPHAQVRKVDKLEVQTPLIAPSFSSLGFPQVSEIWDEFRHKLYGVCLVSAFDIARGSIPSGAVDMVNIVVLDSGLYESSGGVGESDTQQTPPVNGNWTRASYHKVVRDIGEATNIILVSFDHVGSLEEQIGRAAEDFSYASHLASDFLIKPTDQLTIVNLPKLVQYQEALKQFSVIGITAREIGGSFLQRCRSVVVLRDLLNDADMDTPVHVFGAITPYEVLTYFLCGADIFDGLNWLRLAFRSDASISIDESAIEEMKWTLPDLDLLIGEWTNNLLFLYRLQEASLRYAEGGDLQALIEEFPIARQAAHIAETAGAAIRR